VELAIKRAELPFSLQGHCECGSDGLFTLPLGARPARIKKLFRRIARLFAHSLFPIVPVW
jgi:hypothetical protein